MKWGRRKNPIKIQEEEDGIVDEPNTIKKTTSTFSLSNLLPWLSKLKHPNKPNNINHSPKPATAPAPASAPTPAPTPKPLFSPPPLAPTRTHSDVAAPRRLSVGDDESHLTRSRVRIHSLGSASDLDLLLLDPPRSRHHRRRRRSRRYSRASVSETNPDMKLIKAVLDPDPDPIRSGRRSFSGGRVIRPRVRVYSPRLVNPNPIGKERGGGALERFAVVKSSSDPVRDFRESMVEMIWERGIGRRPEELESLLACYLSLNSDEHHDVIVKVFRQVWFDLNREVDRVP